MNVSKCPYCYRPLYTWNHDPILLPDGCLYDWSSATELIKQNNIDKRIYKGIYQITEVDIIELQNRLETLEVETLPENERTTFSPLNTTGLFRITGKHIKEMRDSVEKLLLAVGMSKNEYFNNDEEGNLITREGGGIIDWTDPIIAGISDRELEEKFQVKYIHIEELRKNIVTLWQETWTDNNPLWIKNTFLELLPGSGFEEDDEDKFNFLADQLWTYIKYGSEIGNNDSATHLILSQNLNLEEGNLIFSSNLSAYCGTAPWNCSGGGYLLGRVDLEKIITKNTYLSWTGEFIGEIDSIHPRILSRLNYAYIKLWINPGIPGIGNWLCFIKYGTNSMVIGYASTYYVILENWVGNNINLYNLLQSLGCPMTEQHKVTEIEFKAYEELSINYYNADEQTLDVSSTLSFSIDNIKLGG